MISSKLINALLFPPGLSIILSLIALLLLLAHYRKSAIAIGLVAIASLWLAATPATSQYLYRHLETQPVITPQELAKDAQAIVVLGGGRLLAQAEYDGRDRLSNSSLERLLYAVRLHQKSGLPIITSGGLATDTGPGEAQMMAELSQEVFHIRVAAVETESRTTYENALYTSALLKKRGFKRILLVTHGFHMKRAMAAFNHFGIDVIPAPTAMLSDTSSSQFGAIFHYLPNAETIEETRRALHEIIGLIAYRYRYGVLPKNS